MTLWDFSNLEMREVIHGKMLRKETISIILHDINIYFPGKRALKTDSLIEERPCGQLAPCQSTPGSIIAPQQSLKAAQNRRARRSQGAKIFAERQNQAKVKVQPLRNVAKAITLGIRIQQFDPNFRINSRSSLSDKL